MDAVMAWPVAANTQMEYETCLLILGPRRCYEMRREWNDQILRKTGRLIMKPSESGAPELGEAVPMQHAPPDMTCVTVPPVQIQN